MLSRHKTACSGQKDEGDVIIDLCAVSGATLIVLIVTVEKYTPDVPNLSNYSGRIRHIVEASIASSAS